MSTYCAYTNCGKRRLLAVVVTAGVCLAAAIFLSLLWCGIRRLCRRNRQVSNVAAPPSPPPPDAPPLASLPTFVFASSEGKPSECALCLMELKEGEKGRLLPGCGHRFHVECVDMWLDNHSTCPYCRSPAQVVHAADPPPV